VDEKDNKMAEGILQTSKGDSLTKTFDKNFEVSFSLKVKAYIYISFGSPHLFDIFRLLKTLVKVAKAGS
jgi:hypothetical protein